MKKILIIVDMQNDFIFQDYALGSAEAERAYAALRGFLGAPASNGRYDHVVFTRDTHFPYYANTAEGRKLPVPHCIKDTQGWHIPDGLYEVACYHSFPGLVPTLVDKYTFGSINLPDVLADLIKDEQDEECIFEFCGLCTDICVVSNVLMTKAHFPEVQIRVIEEFCAGVTPESHAAAIATMKSCQIDII